METAFNGLIICLWGLLLFALGAFIVGIILGIMKLILKVITKIIRQYKEIESELIEDDEHNIE
jgi:uncharacterized membrane-anchored protein YhcB (DUF1043 family)